MEMLSFLNGTLMFFLAEIDKVQERSGEIVGVTLYDYLEKNYSVHVRFDQPMSAEELKSILLQICK